MKKLLIILLCVPLIGLGQTQMEMNISAAKKYSDTDSLLNSLYEKLISEYLYGKNGQGNNDSYVFNEGELSK